MSVWRDTATGKGVALPAVGLTREEYDALDEAGLITRPISWPPGRTAQDPKLEQIEEFRP